MKIAITIPGFSQHGGINVILEWANRLTEWHDVTLISNKLGKHQWYPLSPKVKVTTDIYVVKYDCLIITSPHFAYLLDSKRLPKKVFVFMQMLENLFRPQDKAWQRACDKFYKAGHPMFYISEWNHEETKRNNINDCYIGNGVNFDLFPLEYDNYSDKRFNTIIVEGVEPTNETKDVDYIGARVAAELKRMYGFKVLGYAQKEPKKYLEVFDEFVIKPDLNTLNRLYSQSWLFIKATKCDARSTAPLEAATKQCVVVRGINRGDDDLDVSNCYKTDYNFQHVLNSAKFACENYQHAILKAQELQRHIKDFDWRYYMGIINEEISK